MSATLVSLCQEWLSLASSEFNASVDALSAVTHEPDCHDEVEIGVLRAAASLATVAELVCVHGSVLDPTKTNDVVRLALERLTELDSVFVPVMRAATAILRQRCTYPLFNIRQAIRAGTDPRVPRNVLLKEGFVEMSSTPSFHGLLCAIGPHGIGLSALGAALEVRPQVVWPTLDMYRDNLPEGPVGVLPWRRDALFRAVRRPGIPDDIVELGHLGFALLFHMRFKEAHAPA